MIWFTSFILSDWPSFRFGWRTHIFLHKNITVLYLTFCGSHLNQISIFQSDLQTQKHLKWVPSTLAGVSWSKEPIRVRKSSVAWLTSSTASPSGTVSFPHSTDQKSKRDWGWCEPVTPTLWWCKVIWFDGEPHRVYSRTNIIRPHLGLSQIRTGHLPWHSSSLGYCIIRFFIALHFSLVLDLNHQRTDHTLDMTRRTANGLIPSLRLAFLTWSSFSPVSSFLIQEHSSLQTQDLHIRAINLPSNETQQHVSRSFSDLSTWVVGSQFLRLIKLFESS